MPPSCRILERCTPFLFLSWLSRNSDQLSLEDGHHRFGGVLGELDISCEFSFVLLQISKTKRSPATVSYRDLHVMRLSSQLLKSSGVAHFQDLK